MTGLNLQNNVLYHVSLSGSYFYWRAVASESRFNLLNLFCYVCIYGMTWFSSNAHMHMRTLIVEFTATKKTEGER